jgi:hypothetical protein
MIVFHGPHFNGIVGNLRMKSDDQPNINPDRGSAYPPPRS